MPAYTEGPWRLIPRSHERGNPCVVRAHQGGFMVQGLSSEAEDADARLIAAAPDLLEALIAARAELEAYEADATGEHYNNLTLNAAIAKALGEGK